MNNPAEEIAVLSYDELYRLIGYLRVRRASINFVTDFDLLKSYDAVIADLVRRASNE